MKNIFLKNQAQTKIVKIAAFYNAVHAEGGVSMRQPHQPGACECGVGKPAQHGSVAGLPTLTLIAVSVPTLVLDD